MVSVTYGLGNVTCTLRPHVGYLASNNPLDYCTYLLYVPAVPWASQRPQQAKAAMSAIHIKLLFTSNLQIKLLFRTDCQNRRIYSERLSTCSQDLGRNSLENHGGWACNAGKFPWMPRVRHAEQVKQPASPHSDPAGKCLRKNMGRKDSARKAILAVRLFGRCGAPAFAIK